MLTTGCRLQRIIARTASPLPLFVPDADRQADHGNVDEASHVRWKRAVHPGLATTMQ